MTDRSPLAPIIRRQRQDTNLLYATLADAISTSFARLAAPDATITDDIRRRIMADVDQALDIIWGVSPDDPNAAIRDITIRDTTLARFAPLDEAVKRWQAAMDPATRDAVEAEAQRG